MNKLLDFIGTVLTVGIILWNIIEFLAIPALFVVIGLLNSFPWPYYTITIGGYVALFVIAELAAHFIFKALDKKYTPLIARKIQKYFDKNSNSE